MPQTSYTDRFSPAIAGMRGDADDFQSFSKISTDSASIPIGCFVAADGEQGAALPSSTADQLLGPVMGEMRFAPAWTDRDGNVHGDQDADGLVPGTQMDVMKEGTLWVVSETTASAFEPVFVRCVAGVGEQAGAVRNAADASDCQDLTGKARYLTDVANAGDLALIEVRMVGA